MEKVAACIPCVAAALFFIQAALILMRTRFGRPRIPAALLAASLTFCGALPLLDGFDWLREIALAGALAAAGAFLLRSTNAGRSRAWVAACAAFFLMLLFGEAMGYRASLPFLLLRAFAVAGLCIFLLLCLIRIWISVHSVPLMLTILSASSWMAAGCAALVAGIAGAPLPSMVRAIPALLLSLGTGWLVFEQGYPERSGWRGALPGHSGHEDAVSLLRARVLSLENALSRQDRLIAAGTLAAGVAHEFKNTLSAIRVSAEHGLAQTGRESKDRALRLVVGHTHGARDSVVGMLEKIASVGREDSRVMDAALDLEPFLGRERATLRADGVIVRGDLAPDVRFRGCPGDIEQILHNLIQNAARAYREAGTGSPGGEVILVCARRVEDHAVIEVRDSAGGIARERWGDLFGIGASGSGSTGLGLYLSRNLAQANGGALEYEPTEDGSIFRLVVMAEEEGAGT